MNVLELFAGSRSFSKVAEEMGHNTFTTDSEPFQKIDYVTDILDFDYKKVPFKPEIIWASPPCTSFSVASIGSSWIGDYCPKRVETALGMAYVLKTIEIIKRFKPEFWFIENPRGVLRKMAFMEDLERKTVTYCQYGDHRMKPTDIWTNLKWTPRQMCKNGDPCHISAPRGSKTGTQGLKDSYDRSIVPPELCREIIENI